MSKPKPAKAKFNRNSKPSNVDVLTHGHKVSRAKQQHKKKEVLVWDEKERAEWLLGFSKRKKERLEAAKAKARERDHKAKLEARRISRAAKREQLMENFRAVEIACGGAMIQEGADGEEEFKGFGEEKEKEREHEEEYEDEEQIAHVTVVEEFDVDELRLQELEKIEKIEKSYIQMARLEAEEARDAALAASLPLDDPKYKPAADPNTTLPDPSDVLPLPSLPFAYVEPKPTTKPKPKPKKTGKKSGSGGPRKGAGKKTQGRNEKAKISQTQSKKKGSRGTTHKERRRR